MNGDYILIESDNSEDSIVEIKPPEKTLPPVIDIDDDEITINVKNTFNFPEPRATNSSEYETQIIKSISHIGNEGHSHQLNNPSHWTPDMIKFYNDDWGNEEMFVVEKLQEKMDKTPSLWEISWRDLYRNKRNRKHNIRCHNCLQHGHHASKCPEPSYVPKCHMCGVPGHLDDSCPNSICLNCGNQTHEYTTCCNKCRNEVLKVCKRCSMKGHDFINCPDHWRLFHLTTNNSEVVIPEEQPHKKNEEMWCCNCGKKGHYSIFCPFGKDLGMFSDSIPFIISYQKDFITHVPKSIPKEKSNKKWQYRRGYRKDMRNRNANPMHKMAEKERNKFCNYRNNKMKRERNQKRRKRQKQKTEFQVFAPLGL